MLLCLRNIRKTLGDVDVLKGVNLDINEGERIGIVGRNGAGKTTLANIISGRMQPDEGSIIRGSRELKTGYLMQSSSYTVGTFDEMLDVSAKTDIPGDFGDIAGHLDMNRILHSDRENMDNLSGGERTRLALAFILSGNPDLLVMDEPTNHLDFQGVDWLADELKKYHGTVAVISHDRYFLDRVVSRIVEIDGGLAGNYSGNYSFYRSEKIRRYGIQLHQYNEQEKKRKQIETEIEQVKKWSAKAHREAGKVADTRKGKEFYRTAAKRMDSRVKSTVKRLEKMIEKGTNKPRSEPELNFIFENAVKHGRRILEARGITKSFGSRILFKDSSFYILRGDKTALLGPNGCGKTTLLRMILGDMPPDEGEIWLSPSSIVTYISQDVTDMDPDKTPLEILDSNKDAGNFKTRSVLACLGIGNDLLKKPAGNLSLGERTRIKIAAAILDGKDFLILDEPTSHLDLYSREQLENALLEFEGTVLVVTHDRYMLEKVCSKMLVFDGHRIINIDGGFGEYQARQNRYKSVWQGQGRPLDNGVNDAERIREERLVVENRIAVLIGTMGRLSKEDPDYAVLEQEFMELTGKIRKGDFSGA